MYREDFSLLMKEGRRVIEVDGTDNNYGDKIEVATLIEIKYIHEVKLIVYRLKMG